MQNGIIFLNEQFTTMSRASIPLFDLGVVRGYGVFDYLRTYNRIPFHLHKHLSRFIVSAKSIGLFVPKTLSEIEVLITNMINKVVADELSIKLILTGGISEDQLTFEAKPTLAIAVYPFVPLVTQEEYSRGFSLTTTKHERIFPQSKTLVYLPAILALREAKKLGFDDALYINSNNHILESTTSNLFAFKGNKLYTPKEGILSGITREVMLEIAKKYFEVYEEPILYSELSFLDEIFLTSSNKEIVPVVTVDKHPIGTGQPGEKTKFLTKEFAAYTKFISKITITSPK